MALVKIPLILDGIDPKSRDYSILRESEHNRATTATLLDEERYIDALERTVNIMRELREFSDFDNQEFRTILAAILFDLAEIHFLLKDYRQSEKELETLFKVLNRLAKEDPERYGEFNILAMELAARIVRSRKRTIEMLVKQQIQTEALFEKVNSGVASATERLAESLRKVGELTAASGAYKEALKFYSEAIKFSKKRSGRIGRKEIKFTIEMAEIMSRVKTMRQRAKRLLAAVLPHAIALETIELEEDIIALLEMIDKLEEQPSKWKAFTHALTHIGRNAEKEEMKFERNAEKEAKKEARRAEKEAKKAEKEKRRALKEAKKANKSLNKAKKVTEQADLYIQRAQSAKDKCDEHLRAGADAKDKADAAAFRKADAEAYRKEAEANKDAQQPDTDQNPKEGDKN
jgi:tetratricopeptide (TPR) repeat protein